MALTGLMISELSAGCECRLFDTVLVMSENASDCTQNAAFRDRKLKKFLGGGTAPPPRPLPIGEGDTPSQNALVAAKDRRAYYYTREKPSHQVADTVRTRWNADSDWQKAQVVKVHPVRSYDLQYEDGSIRRRTSKHVRFSREPPLVIRE